MIASGFQFPLQVPLAENLADMLLQPKAAQRMSAEQALGHRYFAELPPAIHDLGDGERTHQIQFIFFLECTQGGFDQLTKSI